MKKTILALAISAVSFGAAAAAPSEVDIVNTQLTGSEFTNNLPDGVAKIGKVSVDADGVITYSTFDADGVETSGLTFDTQNGDTIYTGENVLDALLVNHDKGTNVDHQEMRNLTDSEKSTLRTNVVKNTTANGFTNLDLASKHGIEDLSVVTFTVNADEVLVDTNGSAPNGEVLLSKEEMTQAAKNAVVEQAQARYPSQPVEPVEPVEPINGGEIRDADDFNEIMAKWDKDASITTQQTGDKVLTYVDPESGATQHINLSEMTNDQVEILIGQMKDYGNNLDSHTKVQVREHIRTQVENRETLANVQKVDLLNKIAVRHAEDGTAAPKFEIIAGEDGAMADTRLQVTDKNGNVHTLTQEQLDTALVEAKQLIKEEVAKRTDAGTPPVESPVVDPAKAKEAIQKLVDSGANLVDAGKVAQAQAQAQGQAQAAQQQAQIDEIYAQGQTNANDIQTLFGEVDRLDTRIDQTQALNAATVNARPMVVDGQTAFGAGVGYAGSEAALAIGVAHSFEESAWSVSGTVAATSDDVVLGAGTQYTF
ncbi:YadA C-terminal domain-containing protein [Vibrio coralliirubri]|uniref:YadA C-terminal domain-containing protein n=1 Tax=Vibrio coralliirubri TaxID=1516159 RepID=UPI001EE42B20|nr:YadA C-terminal domain-containing protein [Vibrio coralliirubri]